MEIPKSLSPWETLVSYENFAFVSFKDFTSAEMFKN